ncbi:glycosyltransferase family 2 protein [Gemmiger sp.]|uniref:glycosyltransferase family 2 protein n=1 Tax=Gemmiger sp. TaxID=2049027 RepID=UPI00266C7DC3|nr:glycosyltransferase family 2 protein [uncultured Gemmiger sp.]
MPTVSILVPVYKAEKTLDACVESILAQSYADFELLLIDDASPDHCPEMCDAWAEKDPRIRALHPAKTGPGPSGARNAGLDAAKGQWLTMVDSDDTVAPDLLEKLLAGAERSGAELVLCNCRPVTEDGAEHPLPADEQFAKETVLDVNAFWDAFNTPWINQFTGTAHRLYAAKLFDGVRYPLGMLHEDYYVLPDLIARCTKILCLPFTGYYVLRHAGSITDGAKHEVRLAMTKGDIHRAEYFLQNGWYDRAEGALTDAALFLYKNKRGYDLTRPGHKAEFAAVKRELCRVYSALAAQKGAASLKLRAAALRMGLPVFYAYTKILSRR